MSSGVIGDETSEFKEFSRGVKSVSKKSSRLSNGHFKHQLYGNFKRRNTPPSENNNRGFNPLVAQKPLFTKNYRIPTNRDPRSRVQQSPKSTVQDRPPLFTKNYIPNPQPMPFCPSLPLSVNDVRVGGLPDFNPPTKGPSSGSSIKSPVYGDGCLPDFSVPPPSTPTSASRLVITRDLQPSTPNSSSGSKEFR